MRKDKIASKIIDELLIALYDAEFVYRTRVDIKEDSFGRETRKKLV